jgi:ABC-type transporter MlaC component
MRRHILSCFAVAIALAGVAGAAHAQSTSQSTAQDTSRASDSAAQAKHRKHHKMTSNGSVADSAKNQSQSGVMDSTGKSTLGSRIKKTTPTQGQPVTAKGDTLRPGSPSKSTPPDTTRPTSPQ